MRPLASACGTSQGTEASEEVGGPQSSRGASWPFRTLSAAPRAGAAAPSRGALWDEDPLLATFLSFPFFSSFCTACKQPTLPTSLKWSWRRHRDGRVTVRLLGVSEGVQPGRLSRGRHGDGTLVGQPHRPPGPCRTRRRYQFTWTRFRTSDLQPRVVISL